jgi:hypothetical protein
VAADTAGQELLLGQSTWWSKKGLSGQSDPLKVLYLGAIQIGPEADEGPE